MQLEVVADELKDKPHSLIAIDNVPNLERHETEDLIDRIRSLRAAGDGGSLLPAAPQTDCLSTGWAIL